jgi:hypothetical protein
VVFGIVGRDTDHDRGDHYDAEDYCPVHVQKGSVVTLRCGTGGLSSGQYVDSDANGNGVHATQDTAYAKVFDEQPTAADGDLIEVFLIDPLAL